MFKLDKQNNLRFIPSGQDTDLKKSPVYRPLGFNIDEDLVVALKDSLNQLYVTHQKSFDKQTISRHLGVALTRYVHGK